MSRMPQHSATKRPGFVPALSQDGRILYAACGVRNLAYGFMSVVIGLYLAQQGLSARAIGFVFTAALGGGAGMTILLALHADRIGRRRVLTIGAALMALAGAAFALTNNAGLLAAAALVGTISPSGKELGPFLSIEEAVLPQTTDNTHRTSVFAWYNIVASFAGAVGALLAGLPGLFSVTPLAGYRTLVWAYAGAAVVLIVLFSRLSRVVEAEQKKAGIKPRIGLGESRRPVMKLASLFALDSFAGGFAVQGLIAYWFHLRYGVDAGTLGAIFFGANLFSSISFLFAVPLARRIGLLNTMVFTHLPSNILLILVPFMPNLGLSVAVLLARFSLSQLDVPTRQSYSMAIIPAEDRPAAAGVLEVARNAPKAIPALFTGATLAVPSLGLPFIIGGGLKVAYDLSIFSVFRKVKPPEEASYAKTRRTK